MTFIPNQLLAARILAISGIFLSPFTTFLGHHYSRTLYFSQMLLLFSYSFNHTAQNIFSSYVDYSWLSFMPSFTNNYCSKGDFSCNHGQLISPAICWVGGVLLLFLIVKIIACKVPDLRFLKIYSFYRGFFYWFFAPLFYYSTITIIQGIQNSNFDYSWFSAILVEAVFLMVGLFELVVTKCTQNQQQNKWRKLIQFFCHLQISSMVVLIAVYNYCPKAGITKYLVNIYPFLYALIFLFKYKFLYKVGQRISVFVQDAIIIIIYNIFAARFDYITKYSFDFFGLVIIALLELVFLLPKLARECRRYHYQESASSQRENKPKIQTKINNMPNPTIYLPNQSYQGLSYNSITCRIPPHLR